MNDILKLKITGGEGIMSTQNNKSEIVKASVKKGISFGSCLAMIISYSVWKSVSWAIFHGLLGWIYVIYYLLKYEI